MVAHTQDIQMSRLPASLGERRSFGCDFDPVMVGSFQAEGDFRRHWQQFQVDAARVCDLRRRLGGRGAVRPSYASSFLARHTGLLWAAMVAWLIAGVASVLVT
jgi:hypothetical protein